MSFFRIWKSGIFMAICSWFHPFLSNCLRMRAFWKKFSKICFWSWAEKCDFPKNVKNYSTLTMHCDQTTWPTANQKHLGILNWPTCWVTVTLWKSWPTSGNGKKWVICPYLLACPCRDISNGGLSLSDHHWCGAPVTHCAFLVQIFLDFWSSKSPGVGVIPAEFGDINAFVWTHRRPATDDCTRDPPLTAEPRGFSPILSWEEDLCLAWWRM